MTVEEFKANINLTEKDVKESIISKMNEKVVSIGNKLEEFAKAVSFRKVVFECSIYDVIKNRKSCSFVFKNGKLRKALIGEVVLKYNDNKEIKNAYIGFDVGSRYAEAKLVEENASILEQTNEKVIIQRALNNYLVG